MVLTADSSFRPTTNVGIAPAGGGIKQLLIDVGFALAETIITNYVNQKVSAVSKDKKNFANKVIRETFGYARKRYRSRNYRNTKYANKRYRARR